MCDSEPLLKRKKLNSEENLNLYSASSGNSSNSASAGNTNSSSNSTSATKNHLNNSESQQQQQQQHLNSNSTNRAMANGDNKSTQEIDEGLYSRQLYVLGHEAMKKMAVSDVLIVGMGGLGVEIAKNVILAGVKSVTLHDTANCTLKDLSSQFYLSESLIGANRAVASCNHLSELNNYVPTTAFTGDLTEEYLQNFHTVVLTITNEQEQKRISQICRKYNIALIIGLTSGLFGQIFCDFGPEFTVYDTNGAQPLSAMIASISKDKDGVVTCLDESRHGFEDGDYVTFTEVSFLVSLFINPFFLHYRSIFLLFFCGN